MRTFSSTQRVPTAVLATGLTLAQVDALFADVRSYVIGAGGVCLSTFVVAALAGSAALYASSVCLLAIALARLAQTYRFLRQEDRETASTLRWGRLYNASAAIHIAAISGFCLCTFIVSEDPLCRMLAMATVVAYMAGIPGRNFANPVGVALQIGCGAVPLMSAMAFAGSRYAFFTGLLFIPYFVGLSSLARRLRGVFLESSSRECAIRGMAATLETALGNMSHGLMMLDRNACITVYNERLLDLLTIRGENIEGASISTLFKQAVNASSILNSLTASFKERSSKTTHEAVMANGTTLVFTMRANGDGGAVALVHDVTDEKMAAETIRHLAHHDDLTGLMNRASLRKMLEELPTTSHACTKALLYIDLDGFKLVNDSLGHIFGDALIRKAAERLLLLVGRRGVVARLGGDEFAILCNGCDEAHEVYEFASATVAAMREPFDLEGHSVAVGASVGLALYPDDAREGASLLSRSDLALYRAKADGRGRWRRFEVAMETAAETRRILEADLRMAMEQEQFELFYQPIIDHRLGRIATCEALIRWRHPRRGLLAPSEFILVAEEMGLIADIGRWVLDRACDDCSLWPEDVSVAVNISALQFRHGDLVRSVGEALSRSRLAPSRLELELTETVLLQDIVFTSMTMDVLHRRGVKVCLDDFGTGYSGLSYINQLPLTRVKIDRSFLANIDTSERALLMLKGLVRLVAELGLTSVIEGVETSVQLQIITNAMAVDLLQGFLFSRPVELPQLRLLLGDLPALLRATG